MKNKKLIIIIIAILGFLVFASIAKAIWTVTPEEIIEQQNYIMEMAHKNAEISRSHQLTLQGRIRSFQVELDEEIERERNQKRIYESAQRIVEGLTEGM